MGKTLGLTLPARSKPERDAFDLRARQVDTWLNELPRGNIGETARQIFLALVDTNRLDYSYPNRIHFLESSRETIVYITEAMRRHYISINAPMPEKNWKIAEATREIYHAQAKGYLIALEDLLSHSFLFADSRTLTLLIHRAISALGRVMLTCYQSYTPLPADIWTTLHHLYQAAEERNSLFTNISDEHHRYITKTNISSEYARLLLLALASPYRLRHGEVTKVYDTLERWNIKCRLIPLTEADKKTKTATHFGVDLSSNEPPRSMALPLSEYPAAHCRILDTQPLANAIRKEIKSGFKAGETTLTGIEMHRPDLSQDMMRRLLIAWCVIPKRGFPRNTIEEQVEVTLGLSATHQVIITGTRKNAAEQDSFNRTAQYEPGKTTDGIGAPSPVQTDVWDMIYYSGDTNVLANMEEQFNKEQQPTERRKNHYQPETWAVLNESASGYCIHSVGRPKEARAQVGELIGIRRSIRGQTWKWGIGVIRWLKADTQDRLMLGIEMLTPDAAAIGVRGVAQAKHDYQRTLMLPEIRAINQPTTLITAPVPYRVSNQLVINILGKEIMIKLSKQVTNTGLFAQFEFEILEQQQLPGAKKTEQNPDAEFDSVWSSI